MKARKKTPLSDEVRKRVVVAMKVIISADPRVKNRVDFANRLKTTPSRINDWEYNNGLPPTEIQAKLCNEFNISGDWLLTGAGDMKVKTRGGDTLTELAGDIKAIKKKLGVR